MVDSVTVLTLVVLLRSAQDRVEPPEPVELLTSFPVLVEQPPATRVT